MNNIILIFIGAGLGGVFRYWVYTSVHQIVGKSFPYGTLIVNISGCFLMGLLFVLLLERLNGIAPQLRTFLLIGLLGGYTTFSSFSIETVNLFENGAWTNAFLNIFLSMSLCILATWIGLFLGRKL